MNMRGTAVVLAALMVGAGGAQHAHGEGEPLAGTSMLGVDQETGMLWLYGADGDELIELDRIRDEQGQTVRGLSGGGLFHGFGGMHGFHTDPSNLETRLLYISLLLNRGLAETRDVGLGPGPITGVDPIVLSDPESPRGQRWDLYVIQRNVARMVDGDINVNPSNSQQNEFVLTKPDGSTITRDDLHEDGAGDDEDGVYYSGPAVSVRVRPKGNANLNTLTVDGLPYRLHNGQVYLFVAADPDEPMEAKIYNSHAAVHNSTGVGNPGVGGGNGVGGSNSPMGHWWLQLDGARAAVGVGDNDDELRFDEPDSPGSRLIRVDVEEGESEVVAELSRDYEGVAVHHECDNEADDHADCEEQYYTVDDDTMYRVDPDDGSEQRAGGSVGEDVIEVDIIDDTVVVVVEDEQDRVAVKDPGSGQWLTPPVDTGGSTPSGTTIVPNDSVPDMDKVAFD